MTCGHPRKQLEQALQQVKSSIQLETWLYRCQANSKTSACMSEHTSDSRRTDQGKCVEHCGRTSVLRCEAIADQTGTQKVRVTRYCQTLAGESIVVARASSIAWKNAGVCVRASAGSTAKE